MKHISFPIFIVTLLLACKKESTPFYHGEDRVQFARQSTNPVIPYVEDMDYSFAAKGSRTADTLYIPVDLTGRVAGFDRQVKVEVVSSLTNAIQGTDFDLGTHLIKAGQSKGTVVLILKKTSILETETRKVGLRIVASDHFQPGIEKQRNSFVNFYNFMVKPADWDSRQSRYFGTYSRVKHEFILYHLGFPEMHFANSGTPEDPAKYIFNGTRFTQFQNKLRSVLTDLNNGVLQPDANDPFTYPLMDENGAPVIIP